MTTIKATLENGSLLLQEPLPSTKGRFSAVVVISDDMNGPQEPMGFPRQKVTPADITAEEEFEAIGLRDFFGDPVDERIDWEKFFNSSK